MAEAGGSAQLQGRGWCKDHNKSQRQNGDTNVLTHMNIWL